MTLRRFSSQDYTAIAAIVTAIRPGTPLTTEQLLEADTQRDARIKFGGFVAEERGQVIGFVWHTQYADYYQAEKVVLFGAVLPEFRRQGVGTQLLTALEQQLSKLRVTKAQAQVSETDTATLAFLEQRGFRETWRRLEYRLPVAAADTHPLADLRAQLERKNIRVATYSELIDDPERDEKLCALSARLEQDVPYGEPAEQLSLDAFIHERLTPEAVLHDAFFVALTEDNYLGMSSLWKFETYLETEFTGVLPPFRGLGVATLLKLRGVQYAKDHGHLELRTTNDAGNVAMRQLNERLGFSVHATLFRLEKPLSGYAEA